mgnify:CR=1 FL=1
MNVVPEIFPDKCDQAQFQHFAELPGIELYQAHISRYAFEPHTHEAFGIGTIESGAQRFRYRGINYTAPQHSLVMMNPDELHTGESACEAGWCYRMIYIDPQQMERLTGDKNWWFDEAMRTDARLAQPLSLRLANMWRASSALEREGLLLELLELLRPLAHLGKARPQEGAHRFDRVKAYLRDNLAEQVRLETLAAVAGLSPWHFLRSFKQQFHVTPHQMLMAFRLFEAKQRLAQGESAASVAAAVGLTDQAHLTRSFAHRYGITPGRYQKQVFPLG